MNPPGAPGGGGDPALDRPAILLTRPWEESLALAPRIAQLGATPLIFPTLETVPIATTASTSALLRSLQSFDLAIFISRNAVRHGLALVRDHGGWPPELQAAAVGEATARAFRLETNRQPITPSTGADSEALLRCSELQAVSDRRIVIFRGVGGRETLADTLRRRGAKVEYVECYRRAFPQIDAARLIEALRGQRLAGCVAASAEGLENLAKCADAGSFSLLRAAPLFVQHVNIAKHARRLGFGYVEVYEGGEAGLLRSLQEHLSARQPGI